MLQDDTLPGDRPQLVRRLSGTLTASPTDIATMDSPASLRRTRSPASPLSRSQILGRRRSIAMSGRSETATRTDGVLEADGVEATYQLAHGAPSA